MADRHSDCGEISNDGDRCGRSEGHVGAHIHFGDNLTIAWGYLGGESR